MNFNLLLWAIIFITLALVFYTVGVFSERRARTLKKWHVVVFWLGLICDMTGTGFMGQIAKSEAGSTNGLHALTGIIAIILMVIHASWATLTYRSANPIKKQNFHKFSLFVWLVWLIPYFVGMIMGMS